MGPPHLHIHSIPNTTSSLITAIVSRPLSATYPSKAAAVCYPFVRFTAAPSFHVDYRARPRNYRVAHLSSRDALTTTGAAVAWITTPNGFESAAREVSGRVQGAVSRYATAVESVDSVTPLSVSMDAAAAFTVKSSTSKAGGAAVARRAKRGVRRMKRRRGLVDGVEPLGAEEAAPGVAPDWLRCSAESVDTVARPQDSLGQRRRGDESALRSAAYVGTLAGWSSHYIASPPALITKFATCTKPSGYS